MAYSFSAASRALLQIPQLVDMERQCCPFLTFKIVVEAAGELMRLEAIGPREAKAVIANYFDFDKA